MTRPNASTALAEVIVDELVRCGVTDLVLAPGSRSGALAIAAAHHPRMQVIVEIDERSAAFLALGIGRSTGSPAAVLTTSGSAVAHLFPAVVEADTAMVPMLLLTADRPPELHGIGANQTIEQAGLFGSKVRRAVDVGPGEHRPDANETWRAAVCAAVDAAVDGPVHMNVAFREPLVPETDDGRDADVPFVHDVGGRAGGRRWTAASPLERVPPLLASRWTEVERGVVVAGEAPFTSVGSVDRLAAVLGWPLIAEPTLGGRPRQSISTAHHLLSDGDVAAALRPDAAIVVGRVNLSRPVTAWLRTAPTLVVDPRRSDPGAEDVIPALPHADEVGERSGGWRRTWLEVESSARAALDDTLDSGGLTEPRIARDTAAATPSSGTLVAASSMPIRDLDMAMAPGPVRVVSNRGASGIDGFVSTAFGVSAGSGGPVVGLAGDLAILHDSNGFLAAPRPDAVFVVVNNDGGGIFSFLPQVRQVDVFEQIFGTPHGRSFEMLARLHDVGYAPLHDAGTQIAEVIDRGGTWILEARTDRQANPDTHRLLTDAVVTAGRRTLGIRP